MGRLPFLVIAAVAACLLYFHRHAPQTFFDGADILELQHFRAHTLLEHLAALVLPNPGPGFGRPLATLLFGGLSLFWKGSPLPYLAFIAVAHLANLALLLAAVRRFGFSPLGAAVSLAVFGFHAGVAELFWRPGAVAEVAAATLLLASVVAWLHNAPALSAVCFALLLPLDPNAVLLPAALWFLRRSPWVDLATHALLATWALVRMGFQPDYTLFPGSLMTRLTGIGEDLLVFSDGEPGLLLLLLILGALLPARLSRSSCALLFALLLPHLFAARPSAEPSVYLPAIGLALFLGAIVVANDLRPSHALWALGFWFAANAIFSQQRVNAYSGRIEIVRRYAENLLTFRNWPAQGEAILVDGSPPLLEFEAVRALLRLEGVNIPIERLESDRGARHLQSQSLTILEFVHDKYLRIAVREPGRLGDPYLYMEDGAAVLQLGPGWSARQGTLRWSPPQASLQLHRPRWASRFQLTLSLTPQQFSATGPIRVDIAAAGKPFGTACVEKPGSWTYTWKQPDFAALPVDEPILFTLTVTPPWKQLDQRFGVAVSFIGFQADKEQTTYTNPQ